MSDVQWFEADKGATNDDVSFEQACASEACESGRM